MTGNIRNRNVRFYEEKGADRQAWEILHSEAVRAFPSQNDFIIQAINDFYDVSAKYSCGFSNPLVPSIIVGERYLDYFTTIMEDRL